MLYHLISCVVHPDQGPNQSQVGHGKQEFNFLNLTGLTSYDE